VAEFSRPPGWATPSCWAGGAGRGTGVRGRHRRGYRQLRRWAGPGTSQRPCGAAWLEVDPGGRGQGTGGVRQIGPLDASAPARGRPVRPAAPGGGPEVAGTGRWRRIRAPDGSPNGAPPLRSGSRRIKQARRPGFLNRAPMKSGFRFGRGTPTDALVARCGGAASPARAVIPDNHKHCCPCASSAAVDPILERPARQPRRTQISARGDPARAPPCSPGLRASARTHAACS